MAEQLIRNEQVGGSIPFTSSTQKQGSLWRPCFCVNRIKGNRTRRAPAKGEGPVELRAAGGPKQSGARRGNSLQGERRSRRSPLHWRHTYRLPVCFSFSFFISASSSAGNGCQAAGSLRWVNIFLNFDNMDSIKLNHILPKITTTRRSRKSIPISLIIYSYHFVAKRFMKNSVKAASSSSWDT